ncbi:MULTISPECIES: zinc ribbon domain-containing protein [Microbacterium]|uniref:DNA-binding protein n=1 Tax=Microbacterium resistens TaxID=156977 RepID=A0ABY3RX59_9MICO|nr:C4-type zinc ribbon domain-containing protein [Microbacterium resistens]MBW1639431.1 DNA-binding protein [Microbacterium resistens]MDA4895638.1 C4-type zinc ribbon domain-containing protein [Streptomyces sp. MS2A]UGS27533.1 DNA-binding protein [Microbacterium resistens]
MKANPAHQIVLLDIADLDRRIARAEHARTHPPQGERINELAALRQEQLRELTVLTGRRDDVQAELTRVESDVALVEQRRDRDAQRLAATANPKDAVALEQELASLARRQSDLEDMQLDVMGRLEEAEAARAAQQALIDATVEEGTRLTAEAKAQVAAATTEGEQLARDRAALTDSVPPSLLSEYERRAQRTAGAALLRRQTCEGCRMVLSGTDLNVIRQADPEEVVSCPECGCILVRTEESGLQATPAAD